MKCQEFELAVVDLVRTKETSADALAHADACERCAARLADERALSTDLRALAEATSGTARASERVGLDLLAAFRALEPVAEVVPIARRRPGRVWVPAAAAAAAVGLLASVVAYRATSAPIVVPHETAKAPPPAIVPGPPIVDTPAHTDKPAVESGFKSHVTAPVAREVAHGNRFHREPAPAGRGAARDDARREIVTDYYPLVGASDLTPSDGGQIVRVELPRSALAPFGFQMNAERTDRPITADVLLGNDGVARAIRFVQTSSSDGRR